MIKICFNSKLERRVVVIEGLYCLEVPIHPFLNFVRLLAIWEGGRSGSFPYIEFGLGGCWILVPFINTVAAWTVVCVCGGLLLPSFFLGLLKQWTWTPKLSSFSSQKDKSSLMRAEDHVLRFCWGLRKFTFWLFLVLIMRIVQGFPEAEFSD